MNEPTLYREAGGWTPGAIATWVVPVEPITVICKHNTPDALTTSLFLSPVDGKAIPEGTYALVRIGDRVDAGIGGDDAQ